MNNRRNRLLAFSIAPLLLLCALVARAEPTTGVMWIDVRTPTEYEQGHLPQAIQIPYDGIAAGVAKLQLPKDTPIYLYCGSGHRAGIAQQSLQQLGYTHVTNAGGLQDARKLAEAMAD